MSDCVRLENVSKSFGPVDVLRDLSLSLPAGKTTAIVGESGSGKSTLLQLINAVYRPERGTVRVFGEMPPERGVELFRRKIGYAVQGAGLFPHLTSRRNVTLTARLEDWSQERIEQRYRHLLNLMGLDQAISGRYPHQLSGGQQQRVGLCRALMLEPRLLLLDEPFSAIDPITRAGIERQFVAARETEAVSTVMVTHDMADAMRLAQELVILRNGAVLQQGPPATLLESPADSYVRTLLETRV
jgi:osmoprotectant transport system ATP-binding protein